MIKVSVVSTKEIWKHVVRAVFIVIVLLGLFYVYKYLKQNVGQRQFSLNQCLSYISEEFIIAKGNDENEGLEFSTKSMIDSEYKYAKDVSSRSSDSIDDFNKDDDEIVYENNIQNNKIEQENSNLEWINEENVNENSIDEIGDEKVVEVNNSGVKNTYNFKVRIS